MGIRLSARMMLVTALAVWGISAVARAESVEDRAQQTFQASAGGRGASGSWMAEWYFTHGQRDKGLEAIYRALDSISPSKQGHPFESYGLAYCYVRYGHLFDAAHKAKWKAIASGRSPYSYNLQPYPHNYATANLRMTGGVTWYLSAQGLGLENLPKNYPPADDPTRAKWLRRVVNQIARCGMPEYASRPYGVYNTVPLLCLRDAAKDKDLAQMAGVTYEVFLACVAPMWLGGHWVVTPGRSYGDILSQHPASNINFLWVYFGGCPNNGRAPAMPAAAMSYRPPEYLVNIASRRAKPYVATSRVTYVKNDDPAIEHLPSDLLQYTFMNKTYGIYSQPSMPGAVLQEQQVYPNGVMWLDPSGDPSCLWATIPGGGSSHTVGMIERGLEFVQHEESWLMVGKPAPTDPMHYILGFIPRGYQAIQDDASRDGRIYLAYKSVLIAISLPGPFKWNPREAVPPGKKGQQSPGTQFKYPGNSLALAIETRQPDEVTGSSPAEKLKNFSAEIQAKAKLTLVGGLATYRTATGHSLQRRTGEVGLVDGQPYDIGHKPFLENPWMRQPYQQDITQPCELTVSIDGKTHIYDLLKWTITHKNGPSRPTHLVAQAGKGQVALHWLKSLGDPTGYKIKRGAAAGGPYTEVGTSPSAQWLDKDAADGKTYYYVVTSVNAGGESDPSIEARVTTGKNVPPIPADVTAVAGNTQVALRWTACPGATQYRIARSTSFGGPYEAAGSSDKPAYIDSSVKNNTTYYYEVSAANAEGESGFSAEEIATPLWPPLPAPTGVTARMEGGKPVIRWNPVPGTTRYNIQRSWAAGALFSTHAITKTETTWTDTEIGSKGPGSYYRVSAVNAGGEGMTSEVVCPGKGK